MSIAATAEALLPTLTAALADVAEEPRREAERLLAEVLGCSRSRLLAGLCPAPTPEQRLRLDALLARRGGGEPYAYVVGHQDFRGLSLAVTPAVLIPRADTEPLVDLALDLLATAPAGSPVLDACTGSGCIALALKAERPTLALHASDISSEALAVARRNGEHLGLAVQWHHAAALSAPAPAAGWALITANPPYIAVGDGHLPALAHEPELALVSGADGLDLIRALIADARRCLASGAALLLEHGYDQGAAVRALFAAAGYTGIATHRDVGGNERHTRGYWSRT